MVDGSAASAKTTTSREENHASDAKKISVMMTAKESQNIWWPVAGTNKEKVRKLRKNPLLRPTAPMSTKKITE
jgi:hypothetical protein